MKVWLRLLVLFPMATVMFLKIQWQNFCTTTGIRAFVFLYNSGTLVEKLLWLITLTGGFGLTMWDVSTTVMTYNSYPTATKVSVMPNKTFKLDNLLVCLAQDTRELKSFGIKLRNSSKVTELLTRFDSINLTEYFEEKLSYLSQFDVWKRPPKDENYSQILYMSTVLLSYVMKVELVENDSFTMMDLLTMSPNVSESFSLTYEHFQNHSYSPVDLIKLVAANLWCSTLLRVTFQQSFTANPSPDHCKPDLISWFGHLPLDSTANFLLLNCIKLQPDMLEFKSTRDTVSVDFDSSLLHPVDKTEYFTVYVGHESVLTEESQNVLYLQEGFMHMVNVRMAGHYKTFPLQNSKCQGQSYFDCLLQCRADYISQHCGCEPIFSAFLRRNSPTKPYCSQIPYDLDTDEFKNFLLPRYLRNSECQNLSKTHVRKLCAPQCFEPCERKTFQLIGRKTHSAKEDHLYSSIWLFIDSFVYTVFEETILMDTRHFFSQLGGNLSFWLGASFLVLLHVMVFLVKLPFLLVENRQNKTSKPQKQFITDQLYNSHIILRRALTEPLHTLA